MSSQNIYYIKSNTKNDYDKYVDYNYTGVHLHPKAPNSKRAEQFKSFNPLRMDYDQLTATPEPSTTALETTGEIWYSDGDFIE